MGTTAPGVSSFHMRDHIENTSDRTWPLPRAPWIMRMTWSQLLFAHWPVAAEKLRPLIPSGLELDTFQGQAWIGVVPFLMSDVAPRFCPAIGNLSRFLELNVRTYVTLEGKPGVWFCSLDAENPIAVRAARAMFKLPYMDASMSLSVDGSSITYRSQRTHRGEPAADFAATYQPLGDPFRAQPGSLEHWLTARYCLYSANRRGQVYRGEIDHPPWQLSQATCQLKTNSMCQPLGVELAGEPHTLFAQPVKVRAWYIGRCLNRTTDF